MSSEGWLRQKRQSATSLTVCEWGTAAAAAVSRSSRGGSQGYREWGSSKVKPGSLSAGHSQHTAQLGIAMAATQLSHIPGTKSCRLNAPKRRGSHCWCFSQAFLKQFWVQLRFPRPATFIVWVSPGVRWPNAHENLWPFNLHEVVEFIHSLLLKSVFQDLRALTVKLTVMSAFPTHARMEVSVWMGSTTTGQENYLNDRYDTWLFII